MVARARFERRGGDFGATMNQLLYHSSEAAYYIAFIPAEFVDHEEHLADFRLSRYLIFIIFTNSFVVLAAQAAERYILAAPAPSDRRAAARRRGTLSYPSTTAPSTSCATSLPSIGATPTSCASDSSSRRARSPRALVVVFALATTWRRMALEHFSGLGIWQVVRADAATLEVRLARAHGRLRSGSA